MLEEIISDLVARVQKLEQTPATKTDTAVTAGDGKTFFQTPVPIYSGSITATSATWDDSTSGKYIPADAKRAIVFCYVTGTSDAVGLNKVDAKGGGVTMKILAAYEEGSTSAPGPCCYSEVPLSNGRFDVLATIAGGRTSGSFDFEIELVGYVK